MKCDLCDEPATHLVQDVQDNTPDGAEWKQYKPFGPPRKGCAKHRVYSCEWSKEGVRLGRLTDDEGRPIPR